MGGSPTHKVIFELVAALAAATSILIYYEKKSHRKLEEEVLALDKNIKLLQLNKLQTATP
jgi:hypothetical protein